MNKEEQRHLLVRYTRLLAREGLISGSEGNLSVRHGSHILITPAGRLKSELSVEDLAEMDLEGRVQYGHPTSEHPMHLALYREYPEIGAIVHTHPPYTLALSLAGYSFEKHLLVEGEIFLKRIQRIPFAPPGSMELAQKVTLGARQSRVLILEGHGTVTYGRTLEEAVNLSLILEKVSRVTWLTLLLNKKGEGLSPRPEEGGREGGRG